MKKILLSFILLTIPLITTHIQAQTEREQNGLKGPVMSVETYETAFWVSENNRKSGSRNLAGLSLYARNGDLVVLWLFTNSGDGAYYEKHYYSYDRGHRKKTATISRSAKTPGGTFFSSYRAPNGAILVRPEIAESVSTKKTFDYDVRGRLILETTTDHTGNLTGKKLIGYDAHGNAVKYLFQKKDGSIEVETIVQYLDNGQQIQTNIRPGSDLQRWISYRDKNGVELKQEGYTLKPSLEPPVSAKFLLTSRYTNNNSDGKAVTEWVFFKPNGDPESKTVSVRMGNSESSQERFIAGPLPPGSRNENIEPEWIAEKKTVYKNEFDALGNLTKYTWLERRTPTSAYYPVYIYDHTITYY